MLRIHRFSVTFRPLFRSLFSLGTESTPLQNDRHSQSVNLDLVIRIQQGTSVESKSRSRRRKKSKLNPREKYMLKRMRSRHRQNTIGHLKDEVSELTPLYSLTDPWSGFSSLQKARSMIKQKKGVLTKRQESIAMSLGETIKAAQEQLKEHQQMETQVKESKNDDSNAKQPEMKSKSMQKRSSYFKTAAYVKKLQNESVFKDSRSQREYLMESIGARLHKRDLESSCEYLRNSQTETTNEDSRLNKALIDDPSFPRDAARIEAESKDLEDAEQWLAEIMSFATKHEDVLDAMDSTKASTNFDLKSPSSTQADSPLGPLGDDLIKSMEISGISVESLKKEALRELDREKQRKSK